MQAACSVHAFFRAKRFASRVKRHEQDAALSGTRENPPGLGDEYSVCAALQAAGGDELRSACMRSSFSQR